MTTRVRAGTALLSLIVPVGAAAQNLTIGSPGTYVLAANSTSAGTYNVVINADDVTLDLNGKTVRCAPSQPGTAMTFGIYAAGRSRVAIRNGRITGCFYGVNGGYGSHITLENVRLSGNTYIGAEVSGTPNAVFRRVTCDAIAGYTAEAYAICINGLGSAGLVEDSHFRNIYRQPGSVGVGEGVGVLIGPDATGVIIRRNEFWNERLEAATFGVWGAAGSSVTVMNNTFANVQHAVAAVGTAAVTANIFALGSPIAGSAAIVAGSGSAAGNTISTAYEVKLFGVADGGNTIGDPPTASPNGRSFRMCIDGSCYEGTLYRVWGTN
jgi:hypothetical protein